MTRLGSFLLFAWLAIGLEAKEVSPPPPKAHFNDLAGLVSATVATQLNEQLAAFERESSNQILVVIYPRLPSGNSIEDFANRAFNAWGVGQKDKNNGAVLFVFKEDRQMRIEVGYGLEPVLTDATCFRLIEAMKPSFRAGDYDGGLGFAVHSLIAATRGEFLSDGSQALSQSEAKESIVILLVVAFIVLLAFWQLFSQLRQLRRGYYYGRHGRQPMPGSSISWSGSGSGHSGSSSSFSGGGGRSGGGGASGGW